ncbi:unnamed protein product [Didymodactylos carnosus]|uniref:Phage tail collar domain-containing protein n=1 Tax=Didymodactylos carnosus TaxID=1234261 RepID=A0A815K0V8_9BILA|nr:unnamed protein product [Didymodactylos carnosus]CAF4284066.1 unnamed protein product [Didymodactylos carnosus]
MAYATETKVSSKLYDQIWSANDLNPDRITTEINKVFRYNETETKRHNYSDNYFDLNKTHAEASASSGGGGIGFDVFGIVSGNIGGNGASSNTLSNTLATTSQSIFSATEIQYLLTQDRIEGEWTGEKWIPKSFNIFRLTDITDRLQVAIIAKQLIADKSNGAIIRRVSTLTQPILSTSQRALLLTGTIQAYTGDSATIPEPWLLCNGSNKSRIEYQRLFSVIGVKYGQGDGSTTFNLPDLRGRFPLGIDETEIRVNQAAQLGMAGGKMSHKLLEGELPAHKHGRGTFSAAADGVHSHSINDPGHSHGSTGEGGQFGASKEAILTDWKNFPEAKYIGKGTHSHYINYGTTRISVNSNGQHTHGINGESDLAGSGQAFPTISPYQTVHYIIYTE